MTEADRKRQKEREGWKKMGIEVLEQIKKKQTETVKR